MKIAVSRYTLTSLLLVAATAVVSALVGDIGPYLELFAFPVNVVLMALWLYAVVDIYRRRSSSVAARYFLSSSSTIFSIILAAALCLVAGLQATPATTSFAFVAALFYCLTQITLVTLRGLRDRGGVRYLFTLSHLGLWLVLVAGLWGAPDSRTVRMRVGAEPTKEAVTAAGTMTYLDYEVALADFSVTYFDNGVPSDYSADVVVAGQPVTLKVNHPYSVAYGQDIYLVSFEGSEPSYTIVLQIVFQPWRGVMRAGIVMLLLGAVLMFFRGPKR